MLQTRTSLVNPHQSTALAWCPSGPFQLITVRVQLPCPIAQALPLQCKPDQLEMIYTLLIFSRLTSLIVKDYTCRPIHSMYTKDKRVQNYQLLVK